MNTVIDIAPELGVRATCAAFGVPLTRTLGAVTPTQRQAQLAAVVLYIGRANSGDIIGQNRRWTRDTARRLHDEVLRVGGKPLIRATELVAALEREAEHDSASFGGRAHAFIEFAGLINQYARVARRAFEAGI